MITPKNMTEKRLIEELLVSSLSFDDGGKRADIGKLLKQKIPEFSGRVFVVNWIPEQAEDIFTLLVDEHTIVEVEVSRQSDLLVRFELASLQEYYREHPHLSAISRRKLDMAIRLIKENQQTR